MRYDYIVKYVPGKDLKVADALSRSPIPCKTTQTEELAVEAEAFVRLVVRNLSVKDYYIEKIVNAQRRSRM